MNGGPGPWVRLLWILWIGAFLALEFHGVGTPEEGDTLTERTVWWAQVHPAIKVALSGFWLWLAVHMLSRYWWRPIL